MMMRLTSHQEGSRETDDRTGRLLKEGGPGLPARDGAHLLRASEYGGGASRVAVAWSHAG